MKYLLIATAAGVALTLAAAQAQQGQPSQTPQTGQEAQQISPQTLPPDQIRQIQQALKDKGLYRGQVDGVWGPESRSALQTFNSQRSGTTRQSGDRIDRETLTALGVNPAQLPPNNRTSPGSPGSPPSTSPGAPPSTTQPGTPETPPSRGPDSSAPGNTPGMTPGTPGNTPGSTPGNTPGGTSPGGTSPGSPGGNR